VQRQVAEACSDLAAAWQSGQRPALPPFLGRVPEHDRPLLLWERLRLEIACRLNQGESPTAEDYRMRAQASPERLFLARA
jgi:hypothetical protein